MNLKLRLERLADSRAWASLQFADGTAIVGRVLRIGHDYVEVESYGTTDRPRARDYCKHLVPLSLVKYITVESTAFAEFERQRLDYLSLLDPNQETLSEFET